MAGMRIVARGFGVTLGLAAGMEAVAEAIGEAAGSASSLTLSGGAGGITIALILPAGECAGVRRAVVTIAASPAHRTTFPFLEFSSPGLPILGIRASRPTIALPNLPLSPIPTIRAPTAQPTITGPPSACLSPPYASSQCVMIRVGPASRGRKGKAIRAVTLAEPALAPGTCSLPVRSAAPATLPRARLPARQPNRARSPPSADLASRTTY